MLMAVTVLSRPCLRLEYLPIVARQERQNACDVFLSVCACEATSSVRRQRQSDVQRDQASQDERLQRLEHKSPLGN